MSRQKRRQHIISLRVTNDEWESLRESMRLLQIRRVSDVMRDALAQILIPHSLETATVEGAEEVM